MNQGQGTFEIVAQTEAEAIAGWRLDQLLGAGYQPESASLLAGRPDIDLHLAVDLVAQGCPPDTAVRILV